MPQDSANADQVTYWNDKAGVTWAELQDELDRQIEPLGKAAIAALATRPGEHVLDIGCGCGQTTLDLASRVGATGSVTGCDISKPMLAVAKKRAAGTAHASFIEADAQTHPFKTAAFDAAFSRFGVMFFADPIAAFTNIRRALKPEGRLAFVCWRAMAENLWMTLPLAAGLKHLPPPPPPTPGAPGPFAFADPDKVRSILTGAGFADVDIRPHDAVMSGNDLETATRTALRVGPLGALLREHPDARSAVETSVRDLLAANLKDGRLNLPGAVWIVTARNGKSFVGG
jgi:SAM-dependent methyltransferase